MKELQPLLEQITDIVKGTKDFTVSQAPEFVRQFIIKSYLDNAGFMVFFLLTALCFYGIYSNLKDDRDWMPLFIVFAVISFGLAFGVISCSEEMLVIYFAPKVYIVQNIARLLK
jgi:cytochrome c biogenesis protein CcdA